MSLVFKGNTFFIAGREVKVWTWVLGRGGLDGEVVPPLSPRSLAQRGLSDCG